MNNIQELQNRIECLEKENQYLKSLLDNAGISYNISQDTEKQDLFDPDQGARILSKEITAEDANTFFSMFWGRTDVYSKGYGLVLVDECHHAASDHQSQLTTNQQVL